MRSAIHSSVLRAKNLRNVKLEGSSESSNSPYWDRIEYMLTHSTEELVYSLLAVFSEDAKISQYFPGFLNRNVFFWYLTWLHIKPTSFHILFLVKKEKRITNRNFLHSSFCYCKFSSKFIIYNLSFVVRNFWTCFNS